MNKSLKLLVSLVILALVLIISVSVYAATVQNFKDWGVAEVTQEDEVYTIKLTHDLIDGDPKLSQDLIIEERSKSNS